MNLDRQIRRGGLLLGVRFEGGGQSERDFYVVAASPRLRLLQVLQVAPRASYRSTSDRFIDYSDRNALHS